MRTSGKAGEDRAQRELDHGCALRAALASVAEPIIQRREDHAVRKSLIATWGNSGQNQRWTWAASAGARGRGIPARNRWREPPRKASHRRKLARRNVAFLLAAAVLLFSLAPREAIGQTGPEPSPDAPASVALNPPIHASAADRATIAESPERAEMPDAAEDGDAVSARSPAANLDRGNSAAAAERHDDSALHKVNHLFEQVNFYSLWRVNSWKLWLTLLAALTVGVALGRAAAYFFNAWARRVEQRGKRMRSILIGAMAAPASLALIAVGFAIGTESLTMSEVAATFRNKTLVLLYSIAVFWYLYNIVEVVEVGLRRAIMPTRSGLDQQVAPLVRRSLRIFLVVMAVLFTVDSVFNQDIGAWLAGLGIAGLAVSLAAQDTLKNLFGSITILMDQPFRLGDRIVCSGIDGVVEDIGLRSTKVRTLPGNLVTIPNGNIVNSPVENIGRRPAIQRVMNLTITYDTPLEKIRRAIEIVEQILESEELRGPIHPTIRGEVSPPRVFFNAFNADSLNIFVIYWYAPPDWWLYMEHAQTVNLRIVAAFAAEGIEFAFPTQTLFLAKDPARDLALRVLQREAEGA